MNARSYRVEQNISPMDFNVKEGLVESTVSYRSEIPFIENGKLKLSVTKSYMVQSMGEPQHEVLAVQSVYEVPVNQIKKREDIHELYNDATSGLNEAYQAYRLEMPLLPERKFPHQTIEKYQKEIDRVFELFISRN